MTEIATFSVYLRTCQDTVYKGEIQKIRISTPQGPFELMPGYATWGCVTAVGTILLWDKTGQEYIFYAPAGICWTEAKTVSVYAPYFLPLPDDQEETLRQALARFEHFQHF